MVCILERLLYAPTKLAQFKAIPLLHHPGVYLTITKLYQKNPKGAPDPWSIFLIFLTAIIRQAIYLSITSLHLPKSYSYLSGEVPYRSIGYGATRLQPYGN